MKNKSIEESTIQIPSVTKDSPCINERNTITSTKTNSISGSINATACKPRFLSESLHSRTNLRRIFRGPTLSYAPSRYVAPRELSLRKFTSIESMRARVAGMRVLGEYERVDLFHFRTRASRKRMGSIPLSDSAILVRQRCRRRHAFTLQVTSS